MIGFPFTKKRLLRLAPKVRAKHLAFWLRDLYRQELEGKLNAAQKTEILRSYRSALEWTGDKAVIPKNFEEVPFHELLANEFHRNFRVTRGEVDEADFLIDAARPDALTEAPWRATTLWWVAAENIRSAFNLGSIFRSADAAGWEGIILSGSTPDERHPRVRKTAMGAQHWIPAKRADDLTAFLATQNVPAIALETVPQTKSIFDFDWPAKGILVLGNEEYGVTPKTLKKCDFTAHIPQFGRKNSLNVAAAFTLTAFVITRQHHKYPS